MPLIDGLPDVDGLIFDIDGTLVLGARPGGEGGRALPGALELVETLQSRDVPLVFCTNGSSQPPRRYVEHLRAAGFAVSARDCLTPPVVAARMIAAHVARPRALVIGGEGIEEPLEDGGVEIVAPERWPEANVVLVGHDRGLDAAKIEAACQAIWAGAAFFLTSDAPSFPARGGRAVGLSSVIGAGLAHVTGVRPRLTGKPSQAVMDAAAGMLGLDAGRVAVVGDDLALEIEMAKAAGAASVLTLTGTSTAEDVDRRSTVDRPDLVLEDLTHLLARLG
ncbi:HAD-IIA family hydrolase [Capillimicrobium parvum]|uniref:Acid sugar phosphatase n=1 Tax=Capillimicrobium parvum TaxID=2884022 RepID=A0A9E6XV92_9ACTN|nr:HAD hydrolase-like protein [Capillimicrobium parvum]UGS34401.1 Acid sugar phosphatase [Capillimicrobium parvum]